nr:MAG TPA: hypothetical protein [Caudoviricetes sp.]
MNPAAANLPACGTLSLTTSVLSTWQESRSRSGKSFL